MWLERLPTWTRTAVCFVQAAGATPSHLGFLLSGRHSGEGLRPQAYSRLRAKPTPMKNSQIAGGVLAGIILTLGWLYFWGFQLEVHPTALTPDRGSLIASDAPSGSVLSPEDESLPDFGTTPKDQRPPENGSLDSREPVQPELVLMGVVRNSSGHPLSDALVSWSPAERLRSFTPVPPGSWEDQAASMRHFETTASGEFQFPFPQGHGGGGFCGLQRRDIKASS